MPWWRTGFATHSVARLAISAKHRSCRFPALWFDVSVGGSTQAPVEPYASTTAVAIQGYERIGWRRPEPGGEVIQLVLQQSGDVRIVRVKEAKLTYPVLPSFLAEVRAIVEDGARNLVIDLGGVTFIDSASIGCLIDIYWLLKDRGGALKLSGLRPRVDTVLSLTGVHRFVDVYREEAEALAAFGRPPKGKGVGSVTA
jgi:anti-anti-sigma factor